MALQEQKYIFSQCSSETTTTESTKSRLEKTVKVAILGGKKGARKKGGGWSREVAQNGVPWGGDLLRRPVNFESVSAQTQPWTSRRRPPNHQLHADLVSRGHS